MGKFDAACLAPAACMNLRFNHYNIGFQPLRAFARFFLGEGNFAARSGYTVTSEIALAWYS